MYRRLLTSCRLRLEIQLDDVRDDAGKTGQAAEEDLHCGAASHFSPSCGTSSHFRCCRITSHDRRTTCDSNGTTVENDRNREDSDLLHMKLIAADADLVVASRPTIAPDNFSNNRQQLPDCDQLLTLCSTDVYAVEENDMFIVN